jgi:uncharacterized protein with GYD domain
MTTYVMLANWTEQGILKAKDSPRRLDAAKKALKEMSGEFKSFYLTMGDYDMVAIKLRTTLLPHVSACSWACWETSGRAR